MSLLAPAITHPLAYRGPQTVDSGQRVLALGAVVTLHVLVIGGFLLGQRSTPDAPPEPTIAVSLISEAPTASAPAPPQPAEVTPPPPERQMMATPRPTPSPMSAPPTETVTPREPTPAAPAPPSPAPPSAPAATTTAPAAVIPPNFTAAYLNNPVIYPASARRKREEGTVRLRVQVSAEGAPMQVLLDRTSGHPDLDAAALDVVKKRWKFAPAKQADKAVAAWVLVPLEFSLKR